MVNDSQVSEMNETQWVFELETLNLSEERRYDDLALMAKAAKSTAIQLLGLNILPVEDEETGLLRMREYHEVVPLLAAVCREEIAKEIKDRIEDMAAQDLAQAEIEQEAAGGPAVMTADAMDDFMDSDIEFMDDAEVKRRTIVNSPEYEYVSSNIVKNLGEVEKKQFEEVFGFEPQTTSEAVKSVLPASNKPESDGFVRIESEPVEGMPKKRRVEITIEPDHDR
jgi:hypothetical protein